MIDYNRTSIGWVLGNIMTDYESLKLIIWNALTLPVAQVMKPMPMSSGMCFSLCVHKKPCEMCWDAVY